MTSKYTSRQAGSLHAVIIAVLFVALMAALGVVFYQNFIAKKEVVVQEVKPQEEKPLVAQVAFNSKIYSLDHSKTWSIQKDESTPSAIKITSPSGAVQVSFLAREDGLGSVCDSEDGLKISSYNVRSDAVTGLTKEPVYLVETIRDAPGGGYFYNIGLTPDSGATHAAIGESRCNIEYVGIAQLPVYVGETLIEPMVVARIMFPKLDSKDEKPIEDMKQIKDVMGTEEYRAAVEIIQSARKQ